MVRDNPGADRIELCLAYPLAKWTTPATRSGAETGPPRPPGFTGEKAIQSACEACLDWIALRSYFRKVSALWAATDKSSFSCYHKEHERSGDHR
jgi:hypothetical protein